MSIEKNTSTGTLLEKDKQVYSGFDQQLITVAIAGQPNVGKSTVFNRLTGLRQHVGNWPGKTVECKKGKFNYNGGTYRMVDLPGNYSLTANSPEEVIARDFVIKEQPDVVVVVVNAAALERNLYLVSEILSLKVPLVIALNMIDVAEEEGLKIDVKALESAMGVKVVPMVASKNKGIYELKAAINEIACAEDGHEPNLPERSTGYKEVLTRIRAQITGNIPVSYSEDWVALKLIEGDRIITGMMKKQLSESKWKLLQNILSDSENIALGIAGSRYKWIGNIVKSAVKRSEKSQINRTARIDRHATHPVRGILVMLGVLIGMIVVGMAIGMPIAMGLMNTTHSAQAAVASLLVNTPAWISGLVVDGIIFAIGVLLAILVFLIGYFAMYAVLEDIGYMSRVAYMMDNFMRRIGLHGKSFLPMFTGFACNIPAVIGTRVVETERSRLMTVLLAPFIPCPAQIMITAFLASIFFGAAAPLVVIALILLNLVVLGLSGKMLNRVLPDREQMRMIMELPLYHRPNLRTVGTLVWQRIKQFIVKVGPVVLITVTVVWALAYFPNGDIQTSFIARFGRAIAPLGNLMGLKWEMIVALLVSFISREGIIVTMGMLLGATEEGLVSTLGTMMVPAAALSFMVTQMLFMPCVGTLGAMVEESRSWKWPLFSLAYFLIVAFGMGILVYQVARFIL
ncbi:MAG: ferrous iron transport protein B [Actinomycetia bacterium]|nr:ferrous iron transport protein B [Actinomycetes bacterium]